MKNKVKFSTYRTIVNFCPACFIKLDACTNVYGDDPPRAGDFTVCIECGSVLSYDDAMGLVPSTLAESPIEIRSKLASVKMMIEEMKRSGKKGVKPWEQ